jgi:tripartite-type tricarboxylate transporter receptor subunit TctC
MRNFFKKLFIFFIAGLVPAISFAWQPVKPVNVVVAYSPGSGNEILFRKIENIISKTNKVPKFVFEFKPGANEVVGANYFSQAPNDGHTIYVPAIGVWVTAPVWYKSQLKQNPMEWEPVVSLGQTPLALFASTESKINTPLDFAQALRSGSKINVGVGAGAHVMMYEYMIQQTNATSTERIQFNSPAAVAQSVAGNQIEFGISPLSSALELARAGKLKIVGITGSTKIENYNNVADAFKGLDLTGQVGVVLPKHTPKEIVDFYKVIFEDAVNSKEYQDFLKEIYWFDSIRNSNNFKTFISSQRKKWIPIAETIEFK